MGSWIDCLCGEKLNTNLFSTDYGYFLISQLAFDGIPDPVDRKELEQLMFRAEKVLRCSRCARLLVFRKDNSVEYYSRDKLVSDDGSD
jgi:hypothetical protein